MAGLSCSVGCGGRAAGRRVVVVVVDFVVVVVVVVVVVDTVVIVALSLSSALSALSLSLSLFRRRRWVCTRRAGRRCRQVQRQSRHRCPCSTGGGVDVTVTLDDVVARGRVDVPVDVCAVWSSWRTSTAAAKCWLSLCSTRL